MSDAAIRFVHLADVHLGFRQYGLTERAADFVRAFDDAVAYCLRVAPDFVVIAGDLFDSKSIEPSTYAAADIALERLDRAGIPVVANEGNHERWFRRGERSWLWQLSRHGRLRLLRQFDPLTGELQARPWTSARGFGAYTDIGGARVFGVEYLGARLAAHLPEIAASLSTAPAAGTRTVVGLLHTGVDEAVHLGVGGVTLDDLAPIRAFTDYLALGHVHYAYHLPEHAPWIFNPGALEAHNILEGLAGEPSEGEGRARGLFDVTVRPGQPAEIDARFRDDVVARRPFRRLSIDASEAAEFDQLCTFVNDEVSGRLELFSEPPVVELRLTGRLRFERIHLDTERLAEIVRAAFQPLHVRVTLQLAGDRRRTAAARYGTNVRAIEREVLGQLLADSPHADEAEALTAAALDLKAAALEGQSPEALAQHLERRLG
jgi:DNA repair exonuclease SbcCD nuclease subunit